MSKKQNMGAIAVAEYGAIVNPGAILDHGNGQII
jgi:hypothetical protein